jgi:tetratricopeptide (TPR) repeat protein
MLTFCLAAFSTFTPFANAGQVINAKDLQERCSDELNRGDPKQALVLCEHTIRISLPLAKTALDRGFSELEAKNLLKALEEFEKAQDLFSTAFLGLFGKELAWSFSGNTKQLLLARRERNIATFLMTEAWIGSGMAQLALGRKNDAQRSFAEALESNQEVVYFFKTEKNADTLGQAYYLRGLAKSALAELGSSRGSKQEACDAFEKSIELGFKPSKWWMSSDASKSC